MKLRPTSDACVINQLRSGIPAGRYMLGAPLREAALGSHMEDGAFNETCRAGYRSGPR